MNIQHSPLFDTAKVEKTYSEKDGVPVNYVCTSAANHGTSAMDIFYRATPHPEFGNHYFGLYTNHFHQDKPTVMIANADSIESYEFGMIEDDGKYYYSQHRHDYKVVGDKMIDGGRAYTRSGAHDVDVFKIQDGEFVRYNPSE
mgnify:FL=1|jgi:hypothetical protein